MHSGNIENYNFTHGLHRNMITGKWFPLHPHTLGRALTHDEMDYNVLYSQQTLAGWRIFGQNDDLTLSDNELTKSLVFWKISETDVDYARYVEAGYSVDQYIWITPTYDCGDFIILNESTTDAELSNICDNFVINSSSTSPTTDGCDLFGITNETATNAVFVAPDPTATPVPTAAEVPPTATPEPTAAPVPTATEVPPTATPEPTAEPTTFSNMIFAPAFNFNGQWWSTESYGPGIDPADSGQPVPPYANMIYIDYYDNTPGNISALTFRNEVNAVNPPTSFTGWSPYKFFGTGTHWSEQNAFKLQSISDLAYTKRHDPNTVGFPLNVTASGGLSYPGGGIGQLEVGMQIYGSNGSSVYPSNLYGTGALLVSQTEGGPYSSDPSQVWELPQGSFQEEVKDMQRNGTSLRYVIYENWIVKRIVDVAPSSSAIYPMLGFYDNRDWETLVDNWFATNSTCSNGLGVPTEVTKFIYRKLQAAGMWPYGSTYGSLQGLGEAHRTRHTLWKYVNEYGGTLDTALLEEFKIDQGC